MGLFGPSKQEIAWKRFSDEVGGTFYNLSWFNFWESKKVFVYVEPWTIRLDTYSSGGGPHGGGPTYTRMSAPYLSDDGFRLEIYPYGIFIRLATKTLGKLFGMQDIKVDDPNFDREFVIMANEKSKAQALLGNTKIRQLIRSVMPKSDSLKAKWRWWPYFRVALSYAEEDIITDVERLKSILELLIETLNQMREIGSASPIPPRKYMIST